MTEGERMMQSRPKKLVPAAFVGSAAAVSAVVAVAFWLLGGAGSAAAGVTSALDLRSSDAVATSALYPGADAELAFTVSNPNPFRVRVTGATFDLEGASGCSDPALRLTGSVPATTIAGRGSVDVSVAVRMGSSSNDCQGAALSIPVTSISASSAVD
jgi:hypothetical protein